MDLWVFDNDGTLYDDSGTHRSFIEIFSEYSSTLLGVSTKEASEQVTRLKSKWSTEFSAVALMREFGISYSEIVANTYLRIDLEKCNVPGFDLARKRALDAIMGEKIVFTNNPSVFARRVLSYVGLEKCFSDFVGMEETNFSGKPNLGAFQYVESRHPGHGRIIFCDDSCKNLDVALKMGWNTVLYQPSHVEADTISHEHIIISSFSELSNLF